MSTVPARHSGELVVSGDILYEVIDGQIEEKVIGSYETGIASVLIRVLAPFASTNRLGQVFSEMLFRINIAKDLQRRPDLAFVSHARWPYNRRPPRGSFWDMVPDLAIEVVSPTNSAFQVQKKIHSYFEAGVVQVWVIYPDEKEVYVYASPTRITVLQVGQDIEGGDLLPGFRLPVANLFEDDPE
ncbi:MAG: Uma2 family endonuclease [Isosphaeraceae bacterium]